CASSSPGTWASPPTSDRTAEPSPDTKWQRRRPYDVPVDNAPDEEAILDESARFVLVRGDDGYEIRSARDGFEPLMRLSADRHDEEQARSAFRRLVRQERLALVLIGLAVVSGAVWVFSRLALDIPGFISNIRRTFDPLTGDTSGAL